MVRLLSLAFLIIATVVQASPTAAWKVPLETLAPDHKTNEKIRKLETPPGESAFFKPGDELWDVSSVLKGKSLLPYGYLEGSYEDEEKPRGPWKGEWAVWNAHSGMLVAKGTHADLLKAQLAWDFEKSPNFTAAESTAKPNVIRCQFDWLRPGTKDAFQSISMICESGEITKKSVGEISVEADPSVGYSDQAISTRISATWDETKNHGQWEVATALDLQDGKRALLAKHGSGEKGWELYLTCQEERPDGTPAAGARLLETKSGEVRQWLGGDASITGVFRISLKEHRSIVWYPTGGPYGMSLPVPLQKENLGVPEELAKWIDGPLVDVTKLLREQGIMVEEPEFFAGWSQLTAQLIVAGTDQSHASIGRLMAKITGPEPAPLFIESNLASGNSGIVVRNGEKAIISKLNGEDAETIFKVEATRNPNGVGLKLEMKAMADGKERGNLLTATELIPDQWQKVMEAESGEKTEVLIRAGNQTP